MDEILGENPFAMPGESGSMAEVLEAGEWESEEPPFRQEAEARLDEWESELGEQPWSGEQERGWTRPGRHGGRRRAPAYPGQPLPVAGPSFAGAPTTGPTPAPGPATRLATDTAACPDVTYRNEPWTRGKPGRHQTAQGTATQQKVAESAAVRVLELGDFDVDDYRLRPAHRELLGLHVGALADALRRGRILAPVIISVQGRTSSSGSMSHNLALSRHRAINTLNMITCLAKQAGISAQVQARWTPLGESVSQTTTGDSVEAADQRQVRVQIIAPRPAGFTPPAQQPGSSTQGGAPVAVPAGVSPYRPGYPVRRPGFRGGQRQASRVAQLCFEVVAVKRSPGFPWLRTRGLGTVTARIRVHDHRTRAVALYVLQGVVLGANAQSVAGVIGRLSPLARLAAIARRIMRIASQAKIPTRRCAPTSAVARVGDPMKQLGGTAILVIPPAGSGRAALSLRPRSPRVRLGRRLVPIRAKRYPTPVIIVGRLRLAPQGVRWGAGPLRVRELGESEFGELNEFTELSELNELGELTEWEGEGEYGELTESGEANEWAELGESESESRFGELEGLGETTEYGESSEYGEWEAEGEYGELTEYGETNEWTELGESELGEFEGLGEVNEYGETSEWTELGESELGEFEGIGELNEYGEYSELGG